jgi:hypothetical protein
MKSVFDQLMESYPTSQRHPKKLGFWVGFWVFHPTQTQTLKTQKTQNPTQHPNLKNPKNTKPNPTPNPNDK